MIDLDHLDDIRHRNGIPWWEAPAPSRHNHVHIAQTIGYIGLDTIWRCPCEAITRRGHDGWIYLGPARRFAEEVDENGNEIQ